jgi:hypothetical protein
VNFRNEQQVGIFKRYLLERADRSRSRLMRAQIQRWVEWVDAICRRHDRQARIEQIRRLEAAGTQTTGRAQKPNGRIESPQTRTANRIALMCYLRLQAMCNESCKNGWRSSYLRHASFETGSRAGTNFLLTVQLLALFSGHVVAAQPACTPKALLSD